MDGALLTHAPTPARPVVVTGATGNVGREVVRALAAAGHPVRAAVTDPARAEAVVRAAVGGEAAMARVAFVRFDFADPHTHALAFDGAGALFLLRPPALSDAGHDINPAVDAAVAAGVRRVLFLSVQGAEKNPAVPHHAIERHLEALGRSVPGFAHVFLRAAFFMQNLSTTHRADIRRGEIVVPAGAGRTAFVDARDLGDAAAGLLAAPEFASAAYECTGRQALTYDEVAAILTRVLGRPVAYTHPGALRFYRHMRRQGHPRGFVGVMVALYTTARLGLAGHLSPELERLLGRAPRDFETFARDYAEAWQ